MFWISIRGINMESPVQAYKNSVGEETRTGEPALSVILPCYNEQEVLEETYRRVSAVCGRLSCSYELVFVNDGSVDGTWEQLVKLASNDPTLVLINLSRNHGHQLALMAGLHMCRGERIATMDADLQDPPELLPEMLKLMDQGIDVVYARRRSRPGDSVKKRITCAIFYRVLGTLSDFEIPLDTGDFRIINRRVLDVILQMPDRHPFIRGMVPWVGFRQMPFEYDRQERFAGKTKYPFGKLFRLAIDGVISSSTKPLALAGFCGGITAVFALGLLVYAFGAWVFASQVPRGWTSLLIAFSFLSSIQLLVLGIIGLYLGRLYGQSQGRPLFVIEQIVQFPKGRPGQQEVVDEDLTLPQYKNPGESKPSVGSF